MKIELHKVGGILLILLFSLNLGLGQSKFEYGVGIGINHSAINDDIRTQVGQSEGLYKGYRLPALFLRLGYKMNDRFHLNSGLGYSWIGAIRKDRSSRIVATTIEIPLLLEFNATENIHFTTGPLFNYVSGLKNQSEQYDNDILPTAHTRHQFGLRHGIAYSHKLIELSLSYSHYFTDIFAFDIRDSNGNPVGSQISKFKNIQIGIIIKK